MLCGLLPATGGDLEVAGVDLRTARAEARGRIGYVAQKFALYGKLTVRENLEFFGGAYGLRGKALRARVTAALEQFDLDRSTPSGICRAATSSGWRWRPACCTSRRSCFSTSRPAASTRWRGASSGADHGAGRSGVTVIVTTHFMEEAEYCDRIAIQDAGQLLALGTPREVRLQAGSSAQQPIDMDGAFIAIVEQARSTASVRDTRGERMTPFMRRICSALISKETRQLLRDRSNLAVGLVLPVVLILLFGYGLSFDVKDARVTVVLEDSSPTARDTVAGLRGSPYLAPTWATSMAEAERMIRAGQTDAILRVPVDFSQRLAAGEGKLQLLLNGVDFNSASSIESYISGSLAIPTQQPNPAGT